MNLILKEPKMLKGVSVYMCKYIYIYIYIFIRICLLCSFINQTSNL